MADVGIVSWVPDTFVGRDPGRRLQEPLIDSLRIVGVAQGPTMNAVGIQRWESLTKWKTYAITLGSPASEWTYAPQCV